MILDRIFYLIIILEVTLLLLHRRLAMKDGKLEVGDSVVWSDAPPMGYTRTELEKSHGKGPFKIIEAYQTHVRAKGATFALWAHSFFQLTAETN
jgi:hypothetical protein